MAIKGKTFDLQTITAKDDGALYRILSGESDMIVFSGSGTALSINSNILTIAECYLLAGGRYIHIQDGTTIDLGTIPNSSNRGRVILKIDTSLGATQVTLDQVVTEIETIASGGSYRALVKNDINSDNGGSVYEIEFATFTCSSGVASSPALTTSVPTQSIIQTLQEDIDTLADNLENAFPVSIDRGGTNGTTKVSAQQNLGISYESTELTSGTVAAYADALGDREHRVVLGISGQSVTDLPNNSTCTIEIYKFDANSVLCRATMLDGTEFIRTKKSGTWGSWHKTLQES